MEFSNQLLPGAWLVTLKRFEDMRGTFVKTYARTLFDKHEASFEMLEEYYTVSKKDVIRGMHFQLPPHDHAKMVYCLVGAVEDVLVDLRSGPGYGKVAHVRLAGDDPALVLIPKGVAHGFRALVEGSLMVYKTSAEHAPAADVGIRWDSIDYEWDVDQPRISERDLKHPSLDSFVTPF